MATTIAKQVEDLAHRLQAEEQRNQYLVAWLWAFGNRPPGDPALGSEARRLALACDPNLTWPPEAEDPR